MASLNGQTPANTYQGLLKTNDNGTLPSGADPAVPVTDGAGNETPLKLHQDKVDIRKLEINGNDGNQGEYVRNNGSGSLVWSDAGLAPFGGTANQVLQKDTNTNYDYSWQTIYEVPQSGTTGHFLQKTGSNSNQYEFRQVSEVPSNGTTGQVLTKTATDYEWADASGGGGAEVEYGTWTPTVPYYGSGNTLNPARIGSYMKIGTWVYCTGKVNLNAHTAVNTFATGRALTGLPFAQDGSASINKNYLYTPASGGWPPPPPVFQGFHGGTNGTFTIVDSAGVYLADGFIVGFGSYNNVGNTYSPILVLNSTANVSIPASSAMMLQFSYKSAS